MSDDDEPEEGVVYGPPRGLHAVTDKQASLGQVIRSLIGSEAEQAGPATAAWLEQVVARADQDGEVTLTGAELRAALEADAGNVVPLRPDDRSAPDQG